MLSDLRRPSSAYRRGIRLDLTVSPQVSAMLFGRNRAHVAQGLLYRALQSDEVVFFATGKIPKAPPEETIVSDELDSRRIAFLA